MEPLPPHHRVGAETDMLPSTLR